jgi:hypothetical protein
MPSDTLMSIAQVMRGHQVGAGSARRATPGGDDLPPGRGAGDRRGRRPVPHSGWAIQHSCATHSCVDGRHLAGSATDAGERPGPHPSPARRRGSQCGPLPPRCRRRARDSGQAVHLDTTRRRRASSPARPHDPSTTSASTLGHAASRALPARASGPALRRRTWITAIRLTSATPAGGSSKPRLDHDARPRTAPWPPTDRATRNPA